MGIYLFITRTFNHNHNYNRWYSIQYTGILSKSSRLQFVFEYGPPSNWLYLWKWKLVGDDRMLYIYMPAVRRDWNEVRGSFADLICHRPYKANQIWHKSKIQCEIPVWSSAQVWLSLLAGAAEEGLHVHAVFSSFCSSYDIYNNA